MYGLSGFLSNHDLNSCFYCFVFEGLVVNQEILVAPVQKVIYQQRVHRPLLLTLFNQLEALNLGDLMRILDEV